MFQNRSISTRQGQLAGPSAVRSQVARPTLEIVGPPERQSTKSVPKIVGRFDPIPKAFTDDIAAGWLPAMAGPVLANMLRLAFLASQNGYGDGTSGWAARTTLGSACGIGPRQIQNIQRAMISRGWISRDPVGPIDPIDPRNRTGQRWRFLWKTGEMAPRDPNEAPRVKPKRGRPPAKRKSVSTPLEMNSIPLEKDFGVEMHFQESRKCISTNREGDLREENNHMTELSSLTEDLQDKKESGTTTIIEATPAGPSPNQTTRDPAIDLVHDEIDRWLPEANPATLTDAHDTVARLLLLIEGSTASPLKYVRLALRTSIFQDGRKTTIGRYAKGVIENWMRDGYPPDGTRSGPTNVPDPDRQLAEKQAAILAAAKSAEEDTARNDRWAALSSDVREELYRRAREITNLPGRTKFEEEIITANAKMLTF